MCAVPTAQIRQDWSIEEVETLLSLPLNDLLFKAHSIHRQYFDPNAVQVSTLLSIKTGACPEDCKYCPQSVRHHADVEAKPLMDVETVLARARAAKAAGATRFCMGGAWRRPKDKDLTQICEMISQIKALEMETCLTVGMLTPAQAERLADAGLDFYNHNLDTSESYYKEIISTRTYSDRLKTLENVRAAGLKVCCGGILGMGESRSDRAALLHRLATLPEHPESVPINELVQVEGTPLYGADRIDSIEFVRTVAVARILMPRAHVRLAAGRTQMTDELQAMCFFAGANSIFYGEKLLTTPNPEAQADHGLFARLGLRAEGCAQLSETPAA